MGYTIFNAFRCTCSHFQNSIMYQIMFTVILEKSLILSWKGWKCENWVSYRIYQAFSFYIMTWYECQVYPGFLIFVFISIITVRANLTVLHAMSWYDTTSLKLISFKRACSNNCWWTCWQRLWVIIITKKSYILGFTDINSKTVTILHWNLTIISLVMALQFDGFIVAATNYNNCGMETLFALCNKRCNWLILAFLQTCTT